MLFVNFWVAYLPAGRIEPSALSGAIIAGVCGVYLFYRGFQMLQRKRLIENTPTSKIRGAAMGLIEVSGLATGPYLISAPLTGQSCYYYRSIAWQIKKTGKNEQWEKVADDSLHVPFYLDDNTGKLLVDPQGAEMDIHRDFCETYSNSLFSSSLGVPSNVGGFLTRHGVDCDKKTKVEEFCIKPKNALFILGTLSQNHGVSVSETPVRSLVTGLPKFALSSPVLSSYVVPAHSRENSTLANSGSERVVRLMGNEKPSESSAMTQQEKLTSALLKAGITNPAAWAVAGIQNRAVPVSSSVGGGSAAAVRTAPEPFDFHPSVVLMKGTNNPAFFISWRSQKDVVRTLGWKSALMIWGGPLLTVFSVYIISAMFGWL